MLLCGFEKHYDLRILKDKQLNKKSHKNKKKGKRLKYEMLLCNLFVYTTNFLNK